MTRYMWMIHTADEKAEGSVGDVFLSLHGLKATTKEVQLPSRDYEPGTVEMGTIAVRGDLGELQTGLIRTENAERSPWTPDWVKVLRLSDGQQWTAQGGACDADGSCPLLRFEPSSTDDDVQEAEEEPSSDDGSKDDSDKEESDNDRPKLSATILRTYEVFGKLRGQVVPLTQILSVRSGKKVLKPGAQILLTAEESQGFGLGGEPGMWEDLYPGVSPANYGLDPDSGVLASDGLRGWVMDANYLATIFGADWRRVVYGK